MSRTLAVILGASVFPKAKDTLGENEAFFNSARGFRRYLLSNTGLNLSTGDLLDLFNADDPATGLNEKIGIFLDQRKASATDLIVYYVGHGGFSRPGDEYYLAIRATDSTAEYFTSFAIRMMAQTLQLRAGLMRKYLILDSCFSAAAEKVFLAASGAALEVARRQTEDLLPKRGTALLCASGPRNPAKAPANQEFTMFSGALLDCLQSGSVELPLRMSLSDVGDLTCRRILERFPEDAVRPQLHSPDQAEGSLGGLPLFPNPARDGTGIVPDAHPAGKGVPNGSKTAPNNANALPLLTSADRKQSQEARNAGRKGSPIVRKWYWSVLGFASSVALVLLIGRDSSPKQSVLAVPAPSQRPTQVVAAPNELPPVTAGTEFFVPTGGMRSLLIETLKLHFDLHPEEPKYFTVSVKNEADGTDLLKAQRVEHGGETIDLPPVNINDLEVRARLVLESVVEQGGGFRLVSVVSHVPTQPTLVPSDASSPEVPVAGTGSIASPAQPSVSPSGVPSPVMVGTPGSAPTASQPKPVAVGSESVTPPPPSEHPDDLVNLGEPFEVSDDHYQRMLSPEMLFTYVVHSLIFGGGYTRTVRIVDLRTGAYVLEARQVSAADSIDLPVISVDGAVKHLRLIMLSIPNERRGRFKLIEAPNGDEKSRLGERVMYSFTTGKRPEPLSAAPPAPLEIGREFFILSGDSRRFLSTNLIFSCSDDSQSGLTTVKILNIDTGEQVFASDKGAETGEVVIFPKIIVDGKTLYTALIPIMGDEGHYKIVAVSPSTKN
jgi:hypothetical protein